MKTSVKILFALLAATISSPLTAQSSKVGYVDFASIYNKLPETLQLRQKVEAAKQKLQKEQESKQQILDTKIKAYYAYLSDPDTTKNKAKKALYQEIETESKQIQASKRTGEEVVANEENQTRTTIVSRISKAIKEVAADKGYTNVLSTQDAYHYNPGDDITSAVFEKLTGIMSK